MTSLVPPLHTQHLVRMPVSDYPELTAIEGVTGTVASGSRVSGERPTILEPKAKSWPPDPFWDGEAWGFPDVHMSQRAVTLVVASGRERVRIELELKMIFNFIFGRHKKERNPKASALADLHVGESAILAELQLSPPVAEHLMNLGFVPGLEVTVARSGPGGDPRVYRVEGTEIAMRRDVSRHIHVELLGAPAFGD